MLPCVRSQLVQDHPDVQCCLRLKGKRRPCIVDSTVLLTAQEKLVADKAFNVRALRGAACQPSSESRPCRRFDIGHSTWARLQARTGAAVRGSGELRAWASG